AAGRGFFIEDGGYPLLVDWAKEMTALRAVASRGFHLVLRYLAGLVRRRADADLSAEFAAFLGPGARSSMMLPLLGIGRDVPDGRIHLEEGLLQVEWQARRSRPYFERVQRTMADVAGTLGARFGTSWLSRLNRVVTVHPLGGCPMGRSASEGV